ncbi:hypothetical protein [Pseudomonas chlororaphis]|uniref:hypothetical protein n=1 Tax=Pseudomonas chlororaphis TaxID=587753 RepID=UPI00046FF81E|nr:hypothetical protein [Pseudomonas chlororaphis]AVO57337.1 hypothetical protein C6Q18_04940 [Pseudomonas chlororaphis subsp. piscium]NNB46535.1 hypothetical protein [Pseudomonas chlororaphis]WDG73931.1 hypothetical protein PUP65_06110 [Pseudomonas chlororaphis]WDH28432.1 hypothetical protein PUP81_28195 [Pseudomonas chlororaphis]WDH72452.1 hypothetical protein PUP78_06110 [Pseudomonas chlororaphis]
MVDEKFWYSWMALALLLCPILLALVSLTFSYYLSRRYLREMLEALRESSYFHRWTERLQYEGWFEHFLMFISVRGMMLFPNAGVRRGFLCAKDVHNFPPRLKRLLAIKNTLDGVVIVWTVIVYILLKLDS